MIVGLVELVVWGTALIASCTVLNWPLPSAATTSLVYAITRLAAPDARRTRKASTRHIIVCDKGFIREK